jgi:signal peptidase
MTDRKALRSLTAAFISVLLIALLLPDRFSGAIVPAILLLPLGILAPILIKKRSVLSLNRRAVFCLFLAFGATYLLLYYLTGIEFGFVKNIYVLSFKNFIGFILPISVIIVSTEIMRAIIIFQEDKLSAILGYIACVLAEVLIYGNLSYVTSFNRFMDLIGLTFIPAVISNLLYQYTARRYGASPNIAYRLITTLYLYLIPYVPNMADSLFALYNMAVPAVIYAFISALYEKKRRRATKDNSRTAKAISAVVAAMLIGVIMLISNQFRYGTLVIATPSMTGELNVGDAAIFERYDGQAIAEGQVIVFENDRSMIVHRVVNIEKVNNVTRYYTKGDFNDVIDDGYVVDSEIVGLVHFKIPYIGYPTLWLRSLFEN